MQSNKITKMWKNYLRYSSFEKLDECFCRIISKAWSNYYSSFICYVLLCNSRIACLLGSDRVSVLLLNIFLRCRETPLPDFEKNEWVSAEIDNLCGIWTCPEGYDYCYIQVPIVEILQITTFLEITMKE